MWNHYTRTGACTHKESLHIFFNGAKFYWQVHLWRSEVNFIQNLFKNELDFMRYFHRSCILADIGTKPMSALTKAFVLMLASEKIYKNLFSYESMSSSLLLG